MQIESIRTVLMAIEAGSFSAAANRMGVPTSTVGRRVQELELELGRALVVRTARGVRAAPEAEEVMRRLRAVLGAVDDCLAEAGAPVPQLRVLKVTVPLELGLFAVPVVMADLRSQFADVVFEAHAESRRASLLEEELDLAVRIGKLDDTAYLSRRLATEPLCLVVAPGHVPRSVAELSRMPRVELLGTRAGLTGTWDGEPFDLQSPCAGRVASFTSALAMVERGGTFAVVPAYATRRSVNAGAVVVVPGVRFGEVPVHGLFPRRHRDQPVVRAFFDRLSAWFGESPVEREEDEAPSP